MTKYLGRKKKKAASAQKISRHLPEENSQAYGSRGHLEVG